MIRKSILVACLSLLVALPAAAQPDESFMFQTVLILGSTHGPTDLSDVPDNVTEALEDVKEFLPYEHYRLIDASILRSNGDARGRLTGPNGGPEFDLVFRFRPGDEDTLEVRQFGIDTLVAQPHDPERTGHGTPARGEDRAGNEHFGVSKDRLGEQGVMS